MEHAICTAKRALAAASKLPGRHYLQPRRVKVVTVAIMAATASFNWLEEHQQHKHHTEKSFAKTELKSEDDLMAFVLQFPN